MRYIPNTDADCRQMLAAIGVRSVEDLLADIPRQVRVKHKSRLSRFIHSGPCSFSHSISNVRFMKTPDFSNNSYNSQRSIMERKSSRMAASVSQTRLSSSANSQPDDSTPALPCPLVGSCLSAGENFVSTACRVSFSSSNNPRNRRTSAGM